MEKVISKQNALSILEKDVTEICQLLGKQSNLLCRTACPAFEEVADTRIYGFSCEVKFLERAGLLSKNEGNALIRALEEKLGAIQAKTVREAGVADD